MKLFKSFLFSFFVVSLIFSFNVVSAVDEAKTPTEPSQAPLAEVNITNTKIISNDKNVYNISFTLTNGEGLQSGVRYGVSLFSLNEKGEPVKLVDEKVYPESLSLQSNSTIEKSVTYSAPGVLDGNYVLAISSENESGFPFGLVLLDKIKLVSSVKGVEILPETCSTKIEPKTDDTSKNLVLGINDTIRLTCTAVNSKDSSVSVTPYFETYSRSLYGELITTKGGDTKSITFNKLEKKTFSVVLPKGEKSQVYYTKTMLKEGDSYSNAISTVYTVEGVNASIQNLFFDKDYFKRGDVANLSLLWTSSGASKEGLSLNLSILNQKDNKCGETSTQALSQNTKNKKTNITFEIKKSCFNPKAVVTISDNSGNILDQKTFSVETKSVKSSFDFKILIIILFVLILIILGIIFYLKKKKNMNDDNSNIIPPVAIILLLIIYTFIPFNSVRAATFYIGDSGAYAVTSIDKTSYNPGSFTPAGQIIVTSTIHQNGYDPDLLSFKATAGGVTQSFNTSSTVPQVKYFTAPSATGSFTVAFEGKSNDPDFHTFLFCFISDTIINLADGSQKNIQDVKIGDVLKGEKTNNTVLAFHRPILSDGLLYSFNNGRYFVTAEHPFMTTDGWKSMDPNKTRNENIGIEVTKLKEGDILVTENGFIKLDLIKSKKDDVNTKLYNFILDGDHTYYADGYLVHNKQNCNPTHECTGSSTCLNDEINLQPSDTGSCSVCSLNMACGVKQSNGSMYLYGDVISCEFDSGYATCDGGNQTP